MKVQDFIDVISTEQIDKLLSAAMRGGGAVELGFKPTNEDDHREIHCESIQIARIRAEGEGWVLVALRCIQPVHGCSPRFQEVEQKLAQLIPIEKRSREADCSMCGGTGWLSTDNQAIRFAATAATMFRAYRGVILPRDSKAMEGLHGSLPADMVGALFSHDPVGPSPQADGVGSSNKKEVTDGGPDDS